MRVTTPEYLVKAVFTVLLCVSLQHSTSASAPDETVLTRAVAETTVVRKAAKLDRDVAKVVAKLIQDYHYNRPTVDDALSQLLYEEYFLRLDPNRYFFIAQDLEDFSSKKYILDDLLILGNIEFAFDVYERFLQRIRERVDYVRASIKTDYDFDKNESMVVDRSELAWAADKAELDEIWRKRLKNQLLVEKFLIDDEEEEAEENSFDEEKLTPEENVVKRYENYLKFFNDNDSADILEYYLSSMLHVFDPHSSYLNWRSVEDFDIAMKLSLTGIGATLRSVDGYTEVVNVITGGPAEKDGRLQSGDRITAVAQGSEPAVDVVDMPLNKVVRKIRGAKGTEVRLTVIQSLHGAPKVITIIRDEVKLKDQEATGEVKPIVLDDGRAYNLGVIDIPSFYADFEGLKDGREGAKSTSVDVKRIIDRMIKDDQVDGLLIDLRSNGGGSLEEAINLTGLFIPEGPVVQVRNRKGVDVRKDDDNGFYYDIPLVVMVNKTSASASEIFSGAIMDYGRGVIVGGTHTHGKGTVQTVLKLDRLHYFKNKKCGAMKYTMAKFYRVTGASTQKNGVVADIVFPSFLDHMEIGEAYHKFVMSWDEIAPRDVVRTIDVAPMVPELSTRSASRVQANVEMQELFNDIERYGERQKNKTLSLARETRLAMREEDKYWTKRSRAILGKRRPAGAEDEDDKEDQDSDSTEENEPEAADVYLDESLYILADLVDLSEKHNLAQGGNKVPVME